MIKIIIKANSRYPVDRKAIKEKLKKFLEVHGLDKEVELEINFVGDRRMKQLNKTYMHKNGTTDVLSFPLAESLGSKKTQEDLEFVFPPDEILRLGNIVVSYPQARKQAQIANHLVDDEVNRLVKHGLKHLLGIHHD